MDKAEVVKLLKNLLYVRGPSGEEEEVREAASKILKKLSDDTFVDAAGNLIGYVRGKEKNSEESAIHLMTHMDELSLIVKRINPDGSLRVNPLGGIYPFDFGQGPVEILGDKKTLLGIISAKSAHTTEETKERWRGMPQGGNKPKRWEDIHIFTGLNQKELESAGVHPGTRVVIAQSRRNIEEIGPYLASHFFDNRAAMAIGLCTLSLLKKEKKKPKNDLYLVLTTEEEIGAHGASFAARNLPGNTTIAIDVGPVAEEYQTVLNEQPIVVYQDSFTVYHKSLSDDLLKAGKKAKLIPQSAVWSSYGSDASIAKRHGQTGKAGLVCIPTENTHGFEIIHRESLLNTAKLLYHFLT